MNGDARLALMVSVSTFVGWPQQNGVKKWSAENPPRFEEFPVNERWHAKPAPVKLSTRSERMFKTILTNASKNEADFSGHYRITYWMCGSNCAAAALIDLRTGEVFQPPLADPNGRGWDRWIMCAGKFGGTDDEFHLDSRLMIVRCGMNYSERLHANFPDAHYFLWDGTRFRQLLFIPGKHLAN